MTSKPLLYYLGMLEHFDIEFAAITFEDYTGISLSISHGWHWGGVHGSAGSDEYSIELFMNGFNIGNGVEYHRPEHSDVLVMAHVYSTETCFRNFERALADKPGLVLLETEFDKGVPEQHGFTIVKPKAPQL